MQLRDLILIQKNAIGPRELKALAAFIASAKMTDSLVSRFDDEIEEGAVEWVVDRNVRDTQEVRLTDAVIAKLDEIIAATVRDLIDPFYGAKVRDWEPPHILHYGVGGHYTPHVDAETLYKDELGRDYWEKTLDRDLSVVYLLNDDFAGGDLNFSDLDLRVDAKPGTLICFPSDHNYIHGVNPVTAGHRYSIVTWLRLRGTPTPEKINRTTLAEYRRMAPHPFAQPPRVCRSAVRNTIRKKGR